MHSEQIKEIFDKASKLSCYKGKKLKLRLDATKEMLFSSPGKYRLKYWAVLFDKEDRAFSFYSMISLEDALRTLIENVDLVLQLQLEGK